MFSSGSNSIVKNTLKGLETVFSRIREPSAHFTKYVISLPKLVKISVGMIGLGSFILSSILTANFLAPDSKDLERKTNLELQYTAMKVQDELVN